VYHDSLQFWTRVIRAGGCRSKKQAKALRYAIDPKKSGNLVLVDGFPEYRLSRRKVAEVLRASGFCVTRGENAGRALGPQGVDDLVADALARSAVAILRERISHEVDPAFAVRQAKSVIRRGMRQKALSDRLANRHLCVEQFNPAVENIPDPAGWPGQQIDLARIFDE